MTFLGGSRACIGFKFSQLEMSMLSSLFPISPLLTVPFDVEVVLVELISRFKFDLGTKQNIYWHMAGIVTPLLDPKATLEPQLPLKVTVIKNT